MVSPEVASQTIEISSGTIEYSFSGNGPVVLISHGTLGGWDQGYAISRLFIRDSFSVLSVSRAGYLKSSRSTGLTPEDQARSFKELLDRESIPDAAVIGISGGAPGALQFAKEYPERCWALVLISSITQTPPLPPFFRMIIRFQDFMMGIDPLWAMVHKYGLRFLLIANGVSLHQANEIFKDAHLLSVVKGIYEPIKTSSLRRMGMRIDDVQINSLPALETYKDIGVPTYISHAVNDPLAPSKDAAYLASIIPNAKYHEWSDGGHLFFVVHSKHVIPNIERFLKANLKAI